jgi:diguanylate cyclase (GGDEF)-like protein
MKRILVIEDSSFFSRVIMKSLSAKLGVDVTLAHSLSEASAAIEANPDGFALAIVDLTLPDAQDNESVRLTSAHAIPSIVFSGKLSVERRKSLYKLGVIDSVPKDSPASLDYAVTLTGRILGNKDVTVMVVEDSDTTRDHICRMLERQGLEVVVAPDGREALNLLELRPDVRLMLVDYEMPHLNGFDLIREVRRTKASDKLSIIGMSATSEPEFAVNFLKSGASDFIHKPFGYEELLCRVSQNLDMLDHISRFETLATRDFLTGLHNRRHLFEAGQLLQANAQRSEQSLTVAMLDIDFFKAVNDTHGHDAGDLVLQMTAETLKHEFRNADVVARMGGEEFCVVGINMTPTTAIEVFDRARLKLSEKTVTIGRETIGVTISIGVCTAHGDSFEAMISAADKALYGAKEGGRNRVVAAE